MTKYIFIAAALMVLVVVSTVSFDIRNKENKNYLSSTDMPEVDVNEGERVSKEESQDEKSSSSVQEAPAVISQKTDLFKHIVKVECSGGGYESVGSGVVQVDGKGTVNWKVYTNAHVVSPWFDNKGECRVYVPVEPDYYPALENSVQSVSVANNYPDIDFAILEVSSRLFFEDFPLKACDGIDNKIGDDIRVYGYPGSGGETLTVTEGIISGSTYTAYGPIFKISAKIDTGNSGGVAVNETKGCTVGIPTWAGVGEVEGLGYVQSWDMIYSQGGI